MFALLTTFWLRGMTADEYAEMAQRYAPAFADVPGLESKVWLESRETGSYGAVYVFSDRESLDAYLESPLWHTLLGNPHLADVQCESFEVQDVPSRISAPALLSALKAAVAVGARAGGESLMTPGAQSPATKRPTADALIDRYAGRLPAGTYPQGALDEQRDEWRR